MAKKLDLFINGKFIESKTKDWLEVLDPSTQEVLCDVPLTTKEEINLGVESAKNAFDWRDTPPPEKSGDDALSRTSQEKSRGDSKILSKENGKTFEDAKGDVWKSIEIEQAANILHY
ncbi:MAG: hypothetical protein CM15mP86_18840 [Gammaproteobacteria bacterium]|nr:MAG: hypothetical protein CM15mP86_18840 [Gammaproteobacteria bacterium]